MEQVTLQVQQLVQRVQELEATKEQLEQDLYTSQQSLEQMQDWGSKVGGLGVQGGRIGGPRWEDNTYVNCNFSFFTTDQCRL